jgi:hypothetical protein
MTTLARISDSRRRGSQSRRRRGNGGQQNATLG